jgi:hypothetical protein
MGRERLTRTWGGMGGGWIRVNKEGKTNARLLN